MGASAVNARVARISADDVERVKTELGPALRVLFEVMKHSIQDPGSATRCVDALSELGRSSFLNPKGHLVPSEALIAALVSYGVDLQNAGRMAVCVYDAFSALATARVAAFTAGDRSVAVEPGRYRSKVEWKHIRDDGWRANINKITSADGYCYLNAVSFGRRLYYARVLGPRPSMGNFVALLADEDKNAWSLANMSVYARTACRSSMFHVGRGAPVGYREVGPLADVLAAVRDRTYRTAAGPFPSSGRIGGVVTPRVLARPAAGSSTTTYAYAGSELAALVMTDLTTCKCRLHAVPRTVEPRFAATGCCKRPLGRATAVSSLAKSGRHVCAADESVRRADAAMLELLTQGVDPGYLDGKVRSNSFLRLCSSSSQTDIKAFGNGYCYLEAMWRDCYWRLARLLGPNPKLVDVHLAVLWCGRISGRLLKLERVQPGYYHVAVDPDVKGVVSNSGRRFEEAVRRVLAEDVDARLA